MAKLLIIDDDNDICQLLERALAREGHHVYSVTSARKALAFLKENETDLIFCDYRLPEASGKDLLLSVKEQYPQVQVIIMTAYSDVKVAVDVIKSGAYNFMLKPLVMEEVKYNIEQALKLTKQPVLHGEEEDGLDAGNARPAKIYPVMEEERFVQGKSAEALKILSQISLVAPTNYSVIIYGESGTGKESVAFSIHKQSKRADKPFVAVDCGSLTKELAGSELFGHEKGSFTGALQTKIGQFELANGGTIFLDEVANLDYDIQASLLRVIQERKIRRIGAQKEINIDVRIIVAANERLSSSHVKSRFREDLYHRFNEFKIELPPLRERREDIPVFAEFFVRKTTRELNKQAQHLSPETLSIFLDYEWPGNLREMQNVIKRACLLSNSDEIKPESLPFEITKKFGHVEPPAESNEKQEEHFKNYKSMLDLKSVALRAEYDRILQVLREVGFNKSKAARILNIDRKTLYNKINYFTTFFKPMEERTISDN